MTRPSLMPTSIILKISLLSSLVGTVSFLIFLGKNQQHLYSNFMWSIMFCSSKFRRRRKNQMNLNPTYDYIVLLMVKKNLNYTLLDILFFSCKKYLLTKILIFTKLHVWYHPSLVYIRSQLAIHLT